MAIDTLTSSLKLQFNWSAESERAGGAPVKNEQTVVKTLTQGTSKSPTTAAGADQLIGVVRSIAGGGSDEFDIHTALGNVVKDTSAVLARVKGIAFILLGDGETIGETGSEITGTLCTGVKIGGATTNPAMLCFGLSTDTIQLITQGKGGFFGLGVGAHAGYPVVNTEGDQFRVENLDASITASYFVGFVGGAS